jgi:hypothetical protein
MLPFPVFDPNACAIEEITGALVLRFVARLALVIVAALQLP